MHLFLLRNLIYLDLCTRNQVIDLYGIYTGVFILHSTHWRLKKKEFCLIIYLFFPLLVPFIPTWKTNVSDKIETRRRITSCCCKSHHHCSSTNRFLVIWELTIFTQCHEALSIQWEKLRMTSVRSAVTVHNLYIIHPLIELLGLTLIGCICFSFEQEQL